ncbi:MAG TPA: hypothetical protein DDW30_09225 [Clostridiales bacterium]|nr:hypothetical protein [Clostridiales bacterium]
MRLLVIWNTSSYIIAYFCADCKRGREETGMFLEKQGERKEPLAFGTEGSGIQIRFVTSFL